MIETRRIERGYFRNPETSLAKGIKKVFPKTGEAYRTSHIKDITDRAVALPLAVLATPLIAGLAVAIKHEDGGKVFYKETRLGKDGKEVTIWKLRTMHENANQDTDANRQNAHNGGRDIDPRSTKIGEILRVSRLDELPQLWQVVGGQLSLVGMRVANQDSMTEMENTRPSDFKNHLEDYQAAKPGLFNPVTAFADGSINAQYHANAFYAKEASTGVDMLVLYQSGKEVLKKVNKMRKKRKEKKLQERKAA